MAVLWVLAMGLFAARGTMAAPPVAVADAFKMQAVPGAKARVRVLDNDTGSLVPESVTVASPPAHGTAVVTGDGAIVYTRLAGAATADSFIYSVSGPAAGETSTAVVNITFVTGRFDSAFPRLPEQAQTAAMTVVDAFPGIQFEIPHDLDRIPGTRALLVTEAEGRIQVIADTLAPAKALFLDIRDRVHHDYNEQALKGIAVHPLWPAQPYVYVTYNINSSDGFDSGVRLSRFTTTTAPPYAADPGSEQVLIEQDVDNDAYIIHTIGTPAFGSDGYLYVSFGDEEANGADGQNNSQHIDRNLWSGIIRIDVDCKPGNLEPNPDPTALDPEAGVLPAGQICDGDLRVSRTGGTAHYKIPIDNPFVANSLGGSWNGMFNGRAYDNSSPGTQLGAVRTEFYCIGTRNPWQHSPEDDDGDGVVDYVVVGDVGSANREEISFARPGDNLGWAWREGSGPGLRPGQSLNGAVQAAAPLREPEWDYGHGDGPFLGFAVIGGFVYRGDRYPQLLNKLMFSDFSNGNIWSLQRTGGAPQVELVASASAGITALGADPATDEILLVDRNDGVLRRLVLTISSEDFPSTLTETGFFAELTTLAPNPGVHGYDVNLTSWSDHALKRRWFFLPDTNGRFGNVTVGNWNYPAGLVLAKHFDLELRRGDPTSARRLETRFLVLSGSDFYGLTYRWNHILDGEPQTEAHLVDINGDTLDLPVDHDHNSGTPTVTQRWQFPARSSCLTCHNSAAGRVLSFTTAQLNHEGTLAGGSGNFLRLLYAAGYLQIDPGAPELLPKHVRPAQDLYSREARVRSWLDVNCAYCHRGSGGTAPPTWDGRLQKTLAESGLIHGFTVSAPVAPGHRLIVPGAPDSSIVRNRMAVANGYSRMPPLGSSMVDTEALQLMDDYINHEAAPPLTYESWRAVHFGAAPAPEVSDPLADPDGDSHDNHWEWLTSSNPHNQASRWMPSLTHDAGGGATIQFQGLGNRGLRIWRSSDLQNWSVWPEGGNDGVPLNPDTLFQFNDAGQDGRGFFRFEVWER